MSNLKALRMIKMIVCFSAVSVLAFGLEAKTVAWYRFEEGQVGEVATGETVIRNVVDPTKYPGVARVSVATKNSQYDPANPTVLTTDPDEMPQFVAAFPDSIALVNRQDAETELPNKTALDMRNPPDSNSNPFGFFMVDDHEDLRLKTFTLEFFFRTPDQTKSFRSLVARIGSKYTDANLSFRTYGQLGSSGHMYLIHRFTTHVEGESTNRTYSVTTSSFSVDDDRWHHFAIAVDNEAKLYRVYFDYARVANQSFEGELYYEPGYPLCFGGDPQCTYYNFDLSLDEVRLSDQALEPAQMLSYKHASPLAGIADKNTLIYLPFEGGATPVTYGEGDMAKPVTVVPFLENRAVNLAYAGADAVLLAKKGSKKNVVPEDPAEPTTTSDVKYPLLQFGDGASKSYPNTASLHFATNSPSNDFMKPVMLPDSVTRADLFSESLTVELYFKLPRNGFDFSSGDNQNHLVCMSGGFYVLTPKPSYWSFGHLQAYVGDTQLKSDYSGHPEMSKKTFNDNQWHHLAVVYDKAKARGECYVDGELVLWADNVVIPETASYVQNLLLGASYWGDRWCVGFDADELRITRGALSVDEFLRKGRKGLLVLVR